MRIRPGKDLIHRKYRYVGLISYSPFRSNEPTQRGSAWQTSSSMPQMMVDGIPFLFGSLFDFGIRFRRPPTCPFAVRINPCLDMIYCDGGQIVDVACAPPFLK